MQTIKANNTMHTIQQDTLRNTITINIKGLFTEDHAKEVHARLERILPELKPGFTLINDLSEFENVEDGVRKLIKKSMDLINSHNLHHNNHRYHQNHHNHLHNFRQLFPYFLNRFH